MASSLHLIGGKRPPVPAPAAPAPITQPLWPLPDGFVPARRGEIVLVTVPVIYQKNREMKALQLVPMYITAAGEHGLAGGFLFPHLGTEIRLPMLQALSGQAVDNRAFLETCLFPDGIRQGFPYCATGEDCTWQRMQELPEMWLRTGYRPGVGVPAEVHAQVEAAIAASIAEASVVESKSQKQEQL